MLVFTLEVKQYYNNLKLKTTKITNAKTNFYSSVREAIYKDDMFESKPQVRQ